MTSHLFDLKGKTYLVTGASSGIGREICKTISIMNGQFIAVARREELLKELIKESDSHKNKYIVSDLSTNEGIDKVIHSISKIDGIIHSAGIVKMAPLKFYKQSIMDELRSINYDSVLLLMASLQKNKLLNPHSSSVLIASTAGLFGGKGNGIYSGLKAALIGISKVWANELAINNSRVNVVSPAQVKTEITQKLIEDLSEEVIALDEAKYPLGYGNPEDVAYPVVFLLSDAAKWITGQNIILDGGRTACI
jgi:NAD(P)-dependent dehydrogenase (short-subunit alcohol dehydrogenase family)